MQQPNDLSRSLAALEPDSTLISVIEMGQSTWLVAGLVPGVERQPLKKLDVDESALLKLLKLARLLVEEVTAMVDASATPAALALLAFLVAVLVTAALTR